MTKRKKNKRTNNDLQNTTQKTMFPDLALLCYVLSSFMTNHRVCNYINTTGVTSGAGTAYSSGASEFIPGFWWGSCYSIFSFICLFCRSLFVFRGVRVTPSLVLYVCFVDRCLSLEEFVLLHL